jgi:hypothetical protein
MKTVRRGPQSAFARLFPDRYRREELSKQFDNEHFYSPRAEFESRCRLEEKQREKLNSIRLITDFPSRTTKLENFHSNRTKIIFCHCSCQNRTEILRYFNVSSSNNHYDVPRVFYDDHNRQWKVNEHTLT